jgi:hypothetical protein
LGAATQNKNEEFRKQKIRCPEGTERRLRAGYPSIAVLWVREANMPTTLNRRMLKNEGHDWTGKVGVFIMPVLVLTILVLLTINDPRASIWISEAAQAEFVGTTTPLIPDPEPVPETRVLQAAK